MKKQRLSTLIQLFWLLELFLSPIHGEKDGSLFDTEPNFGASIKTSNRNDLISKSLAFNGTKRVKLEELGEILDFGDDENKKKLSPSSRSLFASGSERHEVVQKPYSSFINLDEESSIGQYDYKKNRDVAIVGQSTDGKNTQIIINLNHEPKSYIYEKLKNQKKSLFEEPLKDSYGQPVRENDFFNQEEDETVGPPSPPQDAPFNLYSEYQYLDEEKLNFEEYLDNYDDFYSDSLSGDNNLSAEDLSQNSYFPPSSDSFDIEDTRLPSRDRETFELYQSSNKKNKNTSIKQPSSPPFKAQSPPKRKKFYKSEETRSKSSSPSAPPLNKYEQPSKSEENIVSPPSPSSNEPNVAESSYSSPKIKPTLIGPPSPPSFSESQSSDSTYSSNQDPSRKGVYYSSPSTSQDFSSSFSPVSSITSFPSSSFSSFSTFPSSSLQNAPTITRTVKNLPSTLSSPSSFVTYTSRIIPQSESNSFPPLPIPPPLPSSTFFSQPAQNFVSSTFNTPSFVGPPGSSSTIVSPPSPPTIISPPSPPTIISLPSPPPVISPPSPPTVTTQKPIIKEKPKSHYVNYKVPSDLTLQLQIVHRTTAQPLLTKTESNPNTSINLNQKPLTKNDPSSENRPSYKTKNDDTIDQRSPSSNNIEYHVHVNSVEQLAEITRIFGRNPLSSPEQSSQNIINLNSDLSSSTLSQQRTPESTSSYERPRSNDESILRDNSYGVPNPRDNSNSPKYEAPKLRFPSDTRPTYEAPRSRNPPRSTTYESPRLSAPVRPTYEASRFRSSPARSQIQRRPSYYPPPRSPRRQTPQRTSKSNYSGGRRVRTASSPRNINRNPSKLQEILKFKCVFLCHLGQVEYQEDSS